MSQQDCDKRVLPSEKLNYMIGLRGALKFLRNVLFQFTSDQMILAS
uniref:Uncharacterized protein n=1 Tax=Heterorhabditis bacteriophora TaxID=37862 RepID=A0A1I7WI66_HETBA